MSNRDLHVIGDVRDCKATNSRIAMSIRDNGNIVSAVCRAAVPMRFRRSPSVSNRGDGFLQRHRVAGWDKDAVFAGDESFAVPKSADIGQHHRLGTGHCLKCHAVARGLQNIFQRDNHQGSAAVDITQHVIGDCHVVEAARNLLDCFSGGNVERQSAQDAQRGFAVSGQ